MTNLIKKIKFNNNVINMVVNIEDDETANFAYFIDNVDNQYENLTEYFEALIKQEKDEINKVNLNVFYGIIRHMLKNKLFLQEFEDFLFDENELEMDLRTSCCNDDKCIDLFSKLESKLYQENNLNGVYLKEANKFVSGVENIKEVYEKPLSENAVRVVQGFYPKKQKR